MNLFAAGRRATIVFTGLWVLCGLGIAFQTGTKEIGSVVAFLVFGPVAIFAFSWAIGWIVRGLMGVQSGKDR